MRSPFFWPEFESGLIKRVSIQPTPAPLLGLQHAANVPGLALYHCGGQGLLISKSDKEKPFT